MATDAVIQFKYSDDVHLTAIYKRYDSFPEEVISKLKNYLSTTKNKQWDFLVAEIISKFVFDSVDNKGIKMLYRMPLDEDKSFIFLWEIYPKEELYSNESIPFEKSIYVNIWQGNKKKLIYSGSISDFEV
jgi:hypothetical protein